MIIAVTGTPGTGKTTLSKKLAKALNYTYLDVNKVIGEHNLKGEYDRSKRCYIIDIDKLNKVLIQMIKQANKEKTSIIIDSHLSHYLPKKYINQCIVTKTDLKILKKRLEKRGYNQAKVRENLDSEIFDICLNEAKENKHKIKIVILNKLSDTTKFLEKFI